MTHLLPKKYFPQKYIFRLGRGLPNYGSILKRIRDRTVRTQAIKFDGGHACILTRRRKSTGIIYSH